MDVSELRKRILRALDDAQRDAASRRDTRADAERQWQKFLASTAVPLVRQAADVLKAESQVFMVETPAGSVRLVSHNSPDTYLELLFDPSAADGTVMGRLSVARGRGRQMIDEQPVAPGKTMADLSEDDLARYLVREIPKLVVRS
jgi:hypothetical protein